MFVETFDGTAGSVVGGPVAGSRLRRLREERGLPREELAARAGVSSATIYNVEQGRVRPTKATRRVLALALALDVEDVFPDGAAT